MKILAFDISSVSTGYCCLENGILNEEFGVIIPDKKSSLGTKLCYFKQQISNLIQKHQPDNIIIEDIYCFNKVTFKVLAEYRGVAIQTIFELTGKDPESLMAVEARKIIGLGGEKHIVFNDAIIKFGLKKFNFDFNKDNDIVDAICLAYSAEKLLKGSHERPIPSIRNRKKRRRKNDKKCVQKTSFKISSRQKSRKPRSGRSV